MNRSFILRSLRGKIFLLVASILALAAAFVMLVSRHDVTRTVSASEQHAVSNVLDLARRDIEGRWAALLQDKITTVRNGRHQLIESGTTLYAVLDSYAQLAARGLVDTATAQTMAREWIDGLQLGDQRYAFAYDAQGRIIASGQHDDIGRDMAGVTDFKGRPLAQAMWEDSRNSGHSVAIYRWPHVEGEPETRYAYFGHFRPWNWVIVVSNDVKGITEQVDVQREQMHAAMRDALSHLTLARSGFMFILDRDDTFVVAPPASQQGFLGLTDQETGMTVADSLRPLDGLTASARRLHTARGDWHIESQHYKPLGWTIAAAVPESDFTAPAEALIQRQAAIFAVTMLLVLLASWMLAVRIVRPLEQLTRYSLYLSKHDLKIAPPVPEHIVALPNRHRDEVGRLARAFMLMDQRLRRSVAQLTETTASRDRLENERSIAHAIQVGLLPVPLERGAAALIDMAVQAPDSEHAGGDLHDYFSLPDGRLCVVVGTVADHGLAGASYAAAVRTLIRTHMQEVPDPAETLQQVNRRLNANNPRMMFVSLLVGVLDLHTGSLALANAGHRDAWLLDADNQLHPMRVPAGAACGVLEDVTYARLDTELHEGDSLVLHTETVLAIHDHQAQRFGAQRLHHALLATPPGALARIDAVRQDVRDFTGSDTAPADFTLLIIRRP